MTQKPEQIIEWKRRRGKYPRTYEFPYMLAQLSRDWEEHKAKLAVFADFVPIRIATILEVFVRESVRGLVDAGSPFLERAEKLSKGMRIDFLFAMNLHGQMLTLGDIIAHSISVNDVTNIVATFEGLLPDYIEGITNAREQWIEDQNDKIRQKPIIDDVKAMLAALSRLFEIRHIVTHEAPLDPPYSIEEIEILLAAAHSFIDATHWYIVEVTSGPVPRTQTMMNIQAGDILNKEMKTLDGVVDKVKQRGVNVELLVTAQDAWASFADADSYFQASVVEGGSMYPMIWASAKARLVVQRTSELTEWLRGERIMSDQPT